MKSRKRDSGFSLLTVLSVGFIATLLLFGSVSAVLPVFRSTGDAGKVSLVRAAAETGIDYVVSQLNSSTARSTYDAASVGSSKTSTLPAAALGINSNIAISVTVKNATNPYDVITSPDSNQKFSADNPNNGKKSDLFTNSSPFSVNYWRIIKSTATYEGTSRTIWAVLKPSVKNPTSSNGSSGSGSSGSGSSSSPSNYFASAAFAAQQINLGGNNLVDSWDSGSGQYTTAKAKTSGDIISNGQINLGTSGTTKIQGSVTSYSQQSSSDTAPTITAKLLNTNVSESVRTNGTTSGLFTSFNVGKSIQTKMGAAQLDVNPVQNPPASVSNLGDLVIPANTTVTLAPGDYMVNSISVGLGAQVNVSGSTGARFFVSENPTFTGDAPIKIAGNVNTNGTPANFQVWYSGSNAIKMSGGSYTGTVYAPNAPIYAGPTASNYSSLNIFGAITGKSIQGLASDGTTTASTAKNLNIHFDTNLANAGNLAKSTGSVAYSTLAYDPSAFASFNPNGNLVVAYWQEK